MTAKVLGYRLFLEGKFNCEVIYYPAVDGVELDDAGGMGNFTINRKEWGLIKRAVDDLFEENPELSEEYPALNGEDDNG